MTGFDSHYADGVDRRSEVLHLAALAALAESGVTDPDEDEYIGALERIADSGILDELPYVRRPADRNAAAAARASLLASCAEKYLPDDHPYSEQDYLDALGKAEDDLRALGI